MRSRASGAAALCRSASSAAAHRLDPAQRRLGRRAAPRRGGGGLEIGEREGRARARRCAASTSRSQTSRSSHTSRAALPLRPVPRGEGDPGAGVVGGERRRLLDRRAPRAHGLGVERERPAERAAGERGGEAGRLRRAAGGGEPLLDQGVGQRGEGHPQAAGADGGEQRVGRRGDQHQRGVRRRLLQRLEEGVLGLRVHGVGRVDDHEAAPPLEAAQREAPVHQLPDLVDHDVARRRPPALRLPAAGPGHDPLLARRTRTSGWTPRAILRQGGAGRRRRRPSAAARSWRPGRAAGPPSPCPPPPARRTGRRGGARRGGARRGGRRRPDPGR